MTADRTGHAYEYAEVHVDDLTPTQRDVLNLLVKGHTNAQVGEQLGMTLDGAKWNVSEILTKLGFASREEAAEFWRWYRRPSRRFTRAMRALAAFPAAKWAAGGLGAAAVAGAGVVFATGAGSESSQDEPEPGSFYLRAEIEVTSRAESNGTSIEGDDAPTPESEITTSTLEWWLRDRTHGRWELCRAANAGEDEHCYFGVADGETYTTYDEAENTYQQMRLEEMDNPQAFFLVPAMSVRIGPTYADDLQGFVSQLSTWHDTVEVVREERMLGRDVTLIEARPASRSVSTETRPDGSTERVETGDGVVRYWLASEEMLLLRTSSESDVQDVDARVIELDTPVSISDDRLSFTLPDDARQLDADGNPGSTTYSGSATDGDSVAARPQQRPEDGYCAGDAEYRPASSGAPSGPRIGPVMASIAARFQVPRGLLERGYRYSFPLFIESSAFGDESERVTLRTVDGGEPPSSHGFIDRGNNEPRSELVLEPATGTDPNAVTQFFIQVRITEPGCHQFEVEVAGETYGPFAFEVTTP